MGAVTSKQDIARMRWLELLDNINGIRVAITGGLVGRVDMVEIGAKALEEFSEAER